MREGIQDAEKIRILRDYFAENKMTSELNDLNATVQEFNITTHPENLEALLQDAKNQLNTLSEK